MIPGNSVRDADPACRPEPDDAGADRPHRLLQEIQDIIDKLTAVTQQLNPRH
jgi:hypothetical protein